VLLGGAAVLVAAGLILRYPELIGIGAAGLAALVVALASVARAPAVSVQRLITPPRVARGGHASAQVVICNESRWSMSALLARDLAGQVSLDDLSAAAWLLGELRAAGAGDAVTALATRAAGQVSLDDPSAAAWLLGELRAAGAGDAVTVLLARDPAAQVSLNSPSAVARLLQALDAAGVGDAVTTLATRAAAQVRLNSPEAVARLLRGLRAAGAGDAVTTLATRAANAGMFGLSLVVRPDEASSYRFGREPDGAPSQSWRWQEPASQPDGGHRCRHA